jgi:hypothetical protein
MTYRWKIKKAIYMFYSLYIYKLLSKYINALY